MLKGLKWLGIGLAGLGLLAVLLWAASRFAPISAEQREALALLEQAPPPPGGNAFVPMYMLAYPGIAESEWETAMAGYLRWRTARDQALEGVEDPDKRLAIMAASPDPLVQQGGEPPKRLCRQVTPGPTCLEQVRADPDAFSASLDTAAAQAVLHRLATLPDYSHVRSVFPADPSTPLPALQHLMLGIEAHALAHVQGRSDAALTGICTDIRTARMLLRDSDTLIYPMVAAAWIEQSVTLLGQITSELPVTHALPQGCAAALAPPSEADVSLCPAMQGEFLFARWAVRQDPSGPLSAPDKTLAMLARQQAWPCTAQTRSRLQQDAPVAFPAAPTSTLRFECAGNPVGCILAAIAAPAYGTYQGRQQDAGALLRLAAVQQWLRERRASGDTASVAVQLQALPDALKPAARPLVVGTDGASLEMVRYDTGRGPGPLRIRLAGSGADVAAAPASGAAVR